MQLFWSMRTRAHHHQPRQSVDHIRLIVTVDPVSHREPRIVWSITSLSRSTRLSLCHDPAGHPPRGCEYGGEVCDRDTLDSDLHDTSYGNWWNERKEIVESVEGGEFWSFSFISKNLEFRRVVIGNGPGVKEQREGWANEFSFSILQPITRLFNKQAR